jgi:ribosomal protein L5
LPKLPIDSYFSNKSISKYGNISLTIREPLHFFELEREFEKFSKIPNININIHSTATNKHEGLSLLSYLNIPFK